jgi:hypothetical protein
LFFSLERLLTGLMIIITIIITGHRWLNEVELGATRVCWIGEPPTSASSHGYRWSKQKEYDDSDKAA